MDNNDTIDFANISGPVRPGAVSNEDLSADDDSTYFNDVGEDGVRKKVDFVLVVEGISREI